MNTLETLIKGQIQMIAKGRYAYFFREQKTVDLANPGQHAPLESISFNGRLDPVSLK